METVHEYIDTTVLMTLIQEELNQGRKASFTVTGMSMWPFICHGRDSVIVRKPSSDDMKAGTIVLLKVPNMEKYLLHRITKVHENPDLIETTGDGNCFRDGWFPKESVIGVVTDIEFKGRTVSVHSLSHRMLSTVWRWMYPVRPLLLGLLKRIAKMKAVLIKKSV